LDQMGQRISLLDVVRAVIGACTMSSAACLTKDKQLGYELETLDLLFVSPGRRSPLIFDNRQPDFAVGLHFCPLNDVHSTNFRT